MGFVERRELTDAVVGDPDPDDPVVGGIGDALNEPVLRCAIDQPDGAVVAQEKVGREVGDRRAPRVRVAGDGEQQLVTGPG